MMCQCEHVPLSDMLMSSCYIVWYTLFPFREQKQSQWNHHQIKLKLDGDISIPSFVYTTNGLGMKKNVPAPRKVTHGFYWLLIIFVENVKFEENI